MVVRGREETGKAREQRTEQKTTGQGKCEIRAWVHLCGWGKEIEGGECGRHEREWRKTVCGSQVRQKS